MVRRAVVADAELLVELWTDPRVMAWVGFPEGLAVDVDGVRDRIACMGEGLLGQLLVVVEMSSGEPIGECMMHRPDVRGIARTDIKLLPARQGRGYGTETKLMLLDHLFTHTCCTAVEAIPNRDNAASIRMQEAVGGEKVDEGVYTFPPDVREVTAPVHYHVYRVFRSSWERSGEPD